MLSKEEIKEMKDYFNECITKDTVYEEDLTINYMKIATEYIDQLESEKQKLIEKLEEDKETLKKENADGTLQDYVIRLLEILKGENQVTVK